MILILTRRALAVAVTAAALATLGGMSTATAAAPAARAPKLEVVASFYPLAFVAEAVGGRRVAVANLTPPGTEPHDLELSTSQRDDIEDADVVLVLGSGFQPSIEKAADGRGDATVELRRGLPSGRVVADDPHVWLDPTLMADMVDEIARAFAREDPAGRAGYEARAAELQTRLAALDGRYRDGLASCDRQLVLTAHEAFGYLARAYGLQQEGVSGLAPDSEPDPRRLAELADLAKRRGVTTVFTETLVSPKVARTLAREAGGIRTAVLDPLEGLSAAAQGRGDDYVTVMDRNLERLRRALGCR